MSRTPRQQAFSSRPSDPNAWVRTSPRQAPADAYTARLTIDVTPALRGRIKIIAFERGLTVADMLRVLLEREYAAGDDVAGRAP